MFAISYSPRALRELRKLGRGNPEASTQLQTEINKLKINPFGPHTKKLQGRSGYRLRVGNYRVIYIVERQELVILVVRVGPRGDVYK